MYYENTTLSPALIAKLGLGAQYNLFHTEAKPADSQREWVIDKYRIIIYGGLAEDELIRRRTREEHPTLKLRAYLELRESMKRGLDSLPEKEEISETLGLVNKAIQDYVTQLDNRRRQEDLRTLASLWEVAHERLVPPKDFASPKSLLYLASLGVTITPLQMTHDEPQINKSRREN